MQIEVKIEGLAGVMQTLQSLPPEIVSKAGGPVKAALKKGAQVIQAEVKKNLAAAIARGKDESESTGLLDANVVASRGKAPTGSKGERYLVRVRRKKYSKSGAPTTLKVAQILEYGSSRQNAEPFIRPAFEAKAQDAITTISEELVKRVDATVRRLARQNKGMK